VDQKPHYFCLAQTDGYVRNYPHQVACNRGEGKCVTRPRASLNKFEWIAVRPDELRLRQRNQARV